MDLSYYCLYSFVVLIVFLYKHREDKRYVIYHKQNEKRTVKEKSEKEKYKNILVRPKTKH